MLIKIISWAAVPFSILGNEFIVRKHWLGWLFWLISNVLWIAVNLALGLYPQAVVFAAYFYYTVRGIRKWRRERK